MTRISHRIFPLIFIVFLMPLFSLSISAEEEYSDYDDYLTNNATTFLSDIDTVSNGFDNSTACVNFLELPFSQRQAIIGLDTSSTGYNLVFLDTVGNVYAFRGAWTSSGTYTGGNITFYQSSEVTNGGRYQVNADGTLTKTSAATFTGEIVSVFFWNQRYGGNDPFGTINFDGSLCQVTPPPTSTPFPSDDPYACKFALNEVISNDYVASLVAFAEKQNYETPYFIYRVYYSDSADDMNTLLQSGVYDDVQPFQIKGYVLSTQEMDYPISYVLEYKQLRKLVNADVTMFAEFDLLDPMMYPFYELVLVSTCLETGTFSEIDATNQVTASINQTIIQNSQLIESQNQMNNLIDSGNSSSQSASNSIDSVTSDLNSTSGEFERFEAQFNQDLSQNLELIDISGGNLGNVSDFVSTANFVKVQFDTILNNSGLYKTAITFSLILGLALLLIGRRS